MPDKLNIVDLALSNVDNLEKQYLDILTDERYENVVKLFVDYLSIKLNASVNIKHQSFLKALNDKQYKCIYETFPNNVEEQIKHFGNRGSERLDFDRSFIDGEFFKYFALNAGNFGIPAWGHYCIVFELKEFDSAKSVVLMRNSLEKKNENDYYYFDNGGNLNIEALKIELGPINSSSKIVVLKYRYKIVGISKEFWCDLICDAESNFSRLDYIEIITSQICKLDKNFTLRLKKNDLDLIFQYLANKVESINLPEGWNITVDEFKEFMLAYEKFDFKLETI